MGVSCGRAGRLTAKNGGFRPGWAVNRIEAVLEQLLTAMIGWGILSVPGPRPGSKPHAFGAPRKHRSTMGKSPLVLHGRD